MENNNSKPHAIMFPLPYQGYVTPSIQLAMKLASKGFTITFVNTEFIHHQIITSSQPDYSTVDGGSGDDDIFDKARDLGLDIRYKTMTDGFPAHVDELVGNLVKSDPSVSCLIADTFYTWAPLISQKYKLVNISFWTQPALVFNIYYHMDFLITDGHFPPQYNLKDTAIDYIPGVKAIEPKDLSSYLQETDKGPHEFFDKVFKEVKSADFILCNTIQELESDTIFALQEKKPIFAISPQVLSPFGFAKSSTVPTSLRAKFDCSQWLNTKPRGSGLYISFGSFISPKKCDIEEIAHGVLFSGMNFVWVLHHDAVSCEESCVLPFGFEDMIKDKGLIVPWCNQVEVLSHPSIGGFLTHCGWNSILESLQCSGVPLLCFPLKGDQITNRKLVVDDWRIGLNLCDRKPLTRLEAADKIKCLMSGKSDGHELLEQVIKVRQTVGNAMAKDGSCEKNLHQFIVDVKVKIGERII
ncbi:UDP-glycosyltransferase 86A1 [Morus notabilis]|uniref:Glycosyltransferase n=1 Tax=Morus notabilis TaxID=981085 RepID=W9SLD6_9ROSA|nr:UDP-glycosyltransferase 86A1 [Morus notabilis]